VGVHFSHETVHEGEAKMIKIKLLAALAAGALALPAMAQSGELTPKETAKLEVGQDTVAPKAAKAKSDGKVTKKKERKKVAKNQDKQGAKITKQKRDKPVTTPAR
jgi:hypothetical protein